MLDYTLQELKDGIVKDKKLEVNKKNEVEIETLIKLEKERADYYGKKVKESKDKITLLESK